MLSSNGIASNVNVLLGLSNSLPAWLFSSNAVVSNANLLLGLSNELPAWLFSSNANTVASNVHLLLSLNSSGSGGLPAWVGALNVSSEQLSSNIASLQSLSNLNNEVNTLLSLSNSLPSWLLNSGQVNSNVAMLNALSNNLPSWMWNASGFNGNGIGINGSGSNTSNASSASGSIMSNVSALLALSNELPSWLMTSNGPVVAVNSLLNLSNQLPSWIMNCNVMASNVNMLLSLSNLNSKVGNLLNLSNSLPPWLLSSDIVTSNINSILVASNQMPSWIWNSNTIYSNVNVLLGLSNQLPAWIWNSNMLASNVATIKGLSNVNSEVSSLLALSNSLPAWLFTSNAVASNTASLLNLSNQLPVWIYSQGGIASNTNALLGLSNQLPSWIWNSNMLASNVSTIKGLSNVNSQVSTLLSLSNEVPAWLFSSNAVASSATNILALSNQLPAWIYANGGTSNVKTLLSLSNQLPNWIWNSDILASNVATIQGLSNANYEVSTLLSLSNSLPAWLFSSNAVASNAAYLLNLSNSLPPWLININLAQSNANKLLSLSNSLPAWVLSSNVATSNIASILAAYNSLPTYVLNSNLVNSNISSLLNLSNQVPSWFLQSNTVTNLTLLVNELPWLVNGDAVKSNANILLNLSNQLPTWMMNQNSISSNTSLIENATCNLPYWLCGSNSNQLLSTVQTIKELSEISTNIDVLLTLSNHLPSWIFNNPGLQNDIIQLMSIISLSQSATLPEWMTNSNVNSFVGMWAANSNLFDSNVDQLLISSTSLLSLSNQIPSWTAEMNLIESNINILATDLQLTQTIQSNLLTLINSSNVSGSMSNLEFMSTYAKSNLPYWIYTSNDFNYVSQEVENLSHISANIDVLLTLSNYLPPWILNSNFIESEIILLMTLSNQMPQWLWDSNQLKENVNLIETAFARIPEWSYSNDTFMNGIESLLELSNMPAWMFSASSLESNIEYILNLSNVLPEWYVNSNILESNIQSLLIASSNLPPWVFDSNEFTSNCDRLFKYTSNINELINVSCNLPYWLTDQEAVLSNIDVLSKLSNQNSWIFTLEYMVSNADLLTGSQLSWIGSSNITSNITSIIEFASNLPSWVYDINSFTSNINVLLDFERNSSNITNLIEIGNEIPAWLLDQNLISSNANLLLQIESNLPSWIVNIDSTLSNLTYISEVSSNIPSWLVGSNVLSNVELLMTLPPWLLNESNFDSNVQTILNLSSNLLEWTINSNAIYFGVSNIIPSLLSLSNLPSWLTDSNAVWSNIDYLISLSNVLPSWIYDSNMFTQVANELLGMCNIVESFPSWLWSSNEVNVILGLSNGIPPWYLSSNNFLFSQKCKCNSNIENEFEGPVYIHGDLRIDGNLCARSVVDTLVYQSLELQSGPTTWDFYINNSNPTDPTSKSELVIGDKNGPFVSFDGSNMYINGNIIFGSQTNLPMWLLTENVLNKCLCGSNYENEFEGPVLIDGDLTVKGNLCATSIVNTLVTQDLQLRSGPTVWDFSISNAYSSNPSLEISSSSGNFLSFSQCNGSNILNVPGNFGINGSTIIGGNLTSTPGSSFDVNGAIGIGGGSSNNGWNIYVNSNLPKPTLIFANSNGTFASFDGSNMYIDGNIIFGSQTNVPIWLLTENVLNKCLCGSNYENEFEGPVLIDGDLTVKGNLCATSIVNTLVTQDLQLRSGTTQWDFAISNAYTSNPSLNISTNTGTFMSFSQCNVVTVPGDMSVSGSTLVGGDFTSSGPIQVTGKVTLEGGNGSNGSNASYSMYVSSNGPVGPAFTIAAGDTTFLTMSGSSLNIPGNLGTGATYLGVGGSFSIGSLSNNSWTQSVDSNNNLTFQSSMGTVVEFCEIFVAETLNFTGKHRCVEKSIDSTINKIGQIVYSTGSYVDLDGKKEISIDEALPVVTLTSRRFDSRAFGVIGGIDLDGRFRVGNLAFLKKGASARIIIQSQGEGGIWVSNANGKLKNGDYITTSSIPGYGMRQNSYTKYSYTVAKITCDCDFSSCINAQPIKGTHPPLKTKRIRYKGKEYKASFVGCVYCF